MNKLIHPNTFNTIRLTFLLAIGLLFWAHSPAQCTLACNDGIQISLNASGYTTITMDMLLENTPTGCGDALEVQLTDANNQPISNILDCSHLNQNINAGVVNVLTGNACWTTISLQDFLPPTLDCPDLFVHCHQSVDPDSIGYPIFGDNCTDLTTTDLTFEDNWVDLDCFTTIDNQSVSTLIERFWSVSDDNGLTTTCVQNIYLKKIFFSDIVFPPNKLGIESPELGCLDDPNEIFLTGQLTAFGQPFDNMDYCDLGIFQNDLFFPTCGSGRQLHRTWEVHNWCSGTMTTHTQVINFSDNKAPLMTCPADMTVSTNIFNCTATVYLPALAAEDDCSEFEIIPSWEFGIGYTPYQNVPLGTYPVTYTAYDVCGNESVCSHLITIADEETPVAICKNNLSIGLLGDGTGRIYAHNMDNGSTDNCEIDYIQISRHTSNFTEFVEFDCSDIANSPIPVYLRVTDATGATNTCMGSVDVMDNVNPQIFCPSDITIQCEQDYMDLNQTGRASASDNCGIDSLYFEDTATFNQNCGTATIFRQWMVRDRGNLEKSCTQVITIENNYVLEVVFPTDINLDFCQGSLSPTYTGEPVVSNDACRNVAATYEDQFFTGIGNCETILRHWTVLDWCVYDASSGSTDGRYESSHWIYIEDTQAPVIQCLTETILMVNDATCIDTYVEIPLINVIECDTSVVVENDSPFATQNGADASGVYPFGTHTITYTATDFCGNVGTCTFTLLLECAAPMATIAGNTMTTNGLPVPDVTIDLLGDSIQERLTGTLGDFMFEDIAAVQSYQVLPQKDENDGDGVSTFDIVLVAQHILGINELDSPYKMIAADVNNSGSISTFDIVQIRQLVLFQITSFPNTNSWRFVAADYEFPNPQNPFSDPFPEAIELPNLEEDALHAHFVAIKMGDVNGSWE